MYSWQSFRNRFEIASAGMRPTGYVAFVLIRDANRQAIDFDAACFSEVKNVFMAVVQKPLRTDRFEMAKRAILNGDRFDPVNGVLEDEEIPQLRNDLMRQHRV